MGGTWGIVELELKGEGEGGSIEWEYRVGETVNTCSNTQDVGGREGEKER